MLKDFRVIKIDVAIAVFGGRRVVVVSHQTAGRFEMASFPKSLNVAFVNFGAISGGAVADGANEAVAEPHFGHRIVGGVEITGAHGATAHAQPLRGSVAQSAAD